MTTSLEPEPLISPTAHRVLWILTWTLFALGMLEWFVQGANRPVDPVLSDAALVAVPVIVSRIVR